VVATGDVAPEDPSAALQVKEWVPKGLRAVAAALWRSAERQAERSYELLLAEFAYQERFRRRHPVVPNTVMVPTKTLPPGRDRVVYLGTVTEARGCSLMISVARMLAALPGGPVRLEIIGEAPERKSAEALRQAEQEGILTWHGFLPSQAALARISGALAGLSLLDDLPNFRCSLPTKVVEYGACGIPVITTPLPLAERLVRGTNSGLVVPWRDPEAVVRAVVALRNDLRQLRCWVAMATLRLSSSTTGRRGRAGLSTRWSFLLTEPMQCTPQPRGRWTRDDRRTRLTGSAAAEPGAQAPTEQLLSFIRRYVGRG